MAFPGQFQNVLLFSKYAFILKICFHFQHMLSFSTYAFIFKICFHFWDSVSFSNWALNEHNFLVIIFSNNANFKRIWVSTNSMEDLKFSILGVESPLQFSAWLFQNSFKMCFHFQNMLSFSNKLSFSIYAFIFNICFHFQYMLSFLRFAFIFKLCFKWA